MGESVVLQRFVRPKVVKGNRAHFIVSHLRALIKTKKLEPLHQFLALQLLLYLEGMVDRLPKIYFTPGRGEMATSNFAIPEDEISQGLSSLADSMNEASAKGEVKPVETQPSTMCGDDKDEVIKETK